MTSKASVARETIFCPPDLSQRPFQLTVERTMTAAPGILFRAWTEQFDRWFAAPGALLMTPQVNSPLFWETHFEGQLARQLACPDDVAAGTHLDASGCFWLGFRSAGPAGAASTTMFGSGSCFKCHHMRDGLPACYRKTRFYMG